MVAGLGVPIFRVFTVFQQKEVSSSDQTFF